MLKSSTLGQRAISAGLAVLFLLQTMAAPVLASPPAPVPFDKLVQDYIRSYQSDDRLHKVIYTSRIKKEIFRNAGSAEYVQDLEYLDSQSAASPEAIYDLAKSLQLHWEAQYAVGLGHTQQTRFNTGAKIGAIIGITALGIAMFYHPDRAPKYFQLMRHALPVAGLVAGAGAAHAINASGMLDKDVPLAPAHIMHLGINTEEYHYEDDTFFRDAVSVGVGIAAAMMFVQAVKWINAAATPAKVNPLVLIGSIILSFVVEHEVREGIDNYQFYKLEGKVLESTATVERGLSSGDDGQVFTGADALVKTSVNLSSFLNRSLYQALSDYTSDVASAAQKYGEGSDDFKMKLDQYTQELTSKAREALQEQEFTTDSDYDGYIVRGMLMAHGTDVVPTLDPSSRSLARSYLQGFDGWMAFQEEQVQNCVGPAERDQLFHQYLQSLNDSRDRKLVSQLLQGDIRRQANHMLLQTAALLRSTGKEYVQDHAEFLMSFIARNDLLAITTAPSATGVSGRQSIDLDGGLPSGGTSYDPADGGISSGGGTNGQGNGSHSYYDNADGGLQ